MVIVAPGIAGDFAAGGAFGRASERAVRREFGRITACLARRATGRVIRRGGLHAGYGIRVRTTVVHGDYDEGPGVRQDFPRILALLDLAFQVGHLAGQALLDPFGEVIPMAGRIGRRYAGEIESERRGMRLDFFGKRHGNPLRGVAIPPPVRWTPEHGAGSGYVRTTFDVRRAAGRPACSSSCGRSSPG